MTEKAKTISITSLSLAFLLQLVASVWFLSGLDKAVSLNTNTVQTLLERSNALNLVERDISIVQDDIKEIKKDIKQGSPCRQP